MYYWVSGLFFVCCRTTLEIPSRIKVKLAHTRTHLARNKLNKTKKCCYLFTACRVQLCDVKNRWKVNDKNMRVSATKMHCLKDKPPRYSLPHPTHLFEKKNASSLMTKIYGLNLIRESENGCMTTLL